MYEYDLIFSPADFDAEVYKNPVEVRDWLLTLERTPLVASRLALTALIANDLQVVSLLLQLDSHTMDKGMWLMLRAAQGQFAQVASAELMPSGASPLELEDICFAANSVGTALVERGEIEKGRSYLMTAHVLAQALGLKNRAQNLAIERCRAALLAGEPDSEQLRQQLFNPMPARRRKWSQRTLAETLMAEGRYSAALRELGVPCVVDEWDSDLREMLHALLQLPQHPAADSAYVRIAAALRRPESSSEFGKIEGELESGYAAIAEGLRYLRTSKLTQQAIRVLGRRKMVTPDQQVYRAIILIGAVANGAYMLPASTYDRELSFSQRLREALSQVKLSTEILKFIRYNKPELFVLLMVSPAASEMSNTIGFSEVPLLAGKVIRYGGEKYPTPGRTGRYAVLSKMGLFQYTLSREEKRRLKRDQDKLKEPVVNLGWVARACLRLGHAAKALGHQDECAAWRHSYEQVLEMLTPCVKEALESDGHGVFG